MCLVCDEREEKELGRKEASGKCPYCGGKVLAVDVEIRSMFCCLIPICFNVKRKYLCSLCSKLLVLNH